LRVKRAIDVVSAAIVLLVTSPIMLLVAILIRLNLGTPILFRQERPGLNEELFTLVKFRTMHNLRDTNGLLFEDAKRVTRLGMLLRRTSLDELPEFWKVLLGELSIVGPRPLLVQYLPYYTEQEHRRHSVRPGITGWAQVHGRNRLSFDERLAMDIWYVDHISPWLDLKILLTTIWVVLTQRGFETETFALDELRQAPCGSPGSHATSRIDGSTDSK
jgi:sugar transferase EpsL